MGDDAGDQAQQHDERAEGRQPATEGMRHFELEVEAIEELAAAALAGLDRLPGLRVEVLVDEASAPAVGVAPAHVQRCFALIGQADHPTARMPGIGLQIALGHAQAGHRIEGVATHLGLGPVIDLVLEVRQRPGEEDGEQQPAEDQAGPGMQPGHGLAEAFFHGFLIQ
ncbi:hypothetical protein D3C76_1062910 [compost metagenome]